MSDLVRLIAFISKSSDRQGVSRLAITFLVAASVVAGLTNIVLLALINSTLVEREAAATYLWYFVGLCALLPLSRFLSEVFLIRLTYGVTYELRMQLVRQILKAPLRHLEKLGPSRLVAVLAEDVGRISDTLINLPVLILHLAIVAGCLGYMIYLSWPLVLLVLAVMYVGILTYQLVARAAMQHLRRSRETWDSLVSYFNGLTRGIKELKLHRRRRESFLDRLFEPAAETVRHLNIKSGTLYALANSWGQVLFFVLIGVILYGVPRFRAVEPEVTSGYILTILYMLVPLTSIMFILPLLARASVSIEKVETMNLSLDEAAREDGAGRLLTSGAPWRKIELRGVRHTYYREEEDDMFTLGPIDLELGPGELVFVIGGNGSGKTTLAKLLIGLYEPEEGELRIDGEPVTDGNRDAYRQLFSVVFSDYHLFEALLGLEGPELDENARRYLKRLHLDKKVRVDEGALSTVELSQGQRKRLALLTAFLEDRSIYLFDEWAADQDPYFKKIFYEQIVPELHARGKTVVVISHDDRYYGTGQRILRLDSGRLEYDGAAEAYLQNPGRWIREPAAVRVSTS